MPGMDLQDALGVLIERFDHFSIAVADIDATGPLIALMAGSFFESGLNQTGDFRWVQYQLAGGKVELIAAVDQQDANHFINEFIATRGEGLHHLTFKVTDLRDAVDRATSLGFTVVGYDDTDSEWKEAFIHPKSAHGVLIQLAEFADGTG
jgi:methylmalonyl-CoA/ethylmalonyl-CoA epimerase